MPRLSGIIRHSSQAATFQGQVIANTYPISVTMQNKGKDFLQACTNSWFRDRNAMNLGYCKERPIPCKDELHRNNPRLLLQQSSIIMIYLLSCHTLNAFFIQLLATQKHVLGLLTRFDSSDGNLCCSGHLTTIP